MYIRSKYTMGFKNSGGELLLYNTLAGERSLCKMRDRKNITAFCNNELNLIDGETLDRLVKKEILVSSNLNESKMLYTKILETVNPSVLTLFVNPTENCNFRCRYCYENHIPGRMSAEVMDELVKFIRDNIHKYSGLHVEWFGGEPLLAMECIRVLSEHFIRICKDNRRIYTSSMTTNGYLLNKKNVQELVKFRVLRYQVTIDGVKKVHDRFRVLTDGSGTFDVIWKNLKSIEGSNIRNISVLLRINLTKDSLEDVEDYLKIMSSFYPDERFQVGIFKAGNWLDKAEVGIIGNLFPKNDPMRKIYELILSSDYRINLSTQFLNPGSGVCYAGKNNNFLICTDGSVHKCTVTFEDESTTVAVMSDSRMAKKVRYYDMISDFRSCEDFDDCICAPVCMGQPCPTKSTEGKSCSYNKNNLDLIIQILDKNKTFECID